MLTSMLRQRTPITTEGAPAARADRRSYVCQVFIPGAWFVLSEAGDHDSPDRVVRVAVAAAVEKVAAIDQTRRRGDRCDATQHCPLRFGADALRVVAGNDKQHRCGVDANTNTFNSSSAAALTSGAITAPSSRRTVHLPGVGAHGALGGRLSGMRFESNRPT